MKINFNAEDHIYTKEDGTVIPSVTQILKAMGFINTKWFQPADSLRGDNVHLACLFLMEGDLDWDSIDPNIEGYVRGCDEFLRVSGFQPELKEFIVYNEVWGYVGTLDITGTINSIYGLIDIKSGGNPPWAGLQTAAYDLALQSMKDQKNPEKRWSLNLKKDGKYSLKPYSDKDDFREWCSIVETYNARKRRKLL